MIICLVLVSSEFAQGTGAASGNPVNMFTFRKAVRENPTDRQSIVRQANEILRDTKENRLFIAQSGQIADLLFDANILPEDALGYAQRGLDACNFDEFARSTRRIVSSNGGAEQTDEALREGFDSYKARLLSVKGRLEVRLNKPGAKATLAESLKLDRMNGVTALALAEIYEKEKDTKAAFLQLIPAVFSGGVREALIEKLEALYRANNGGKLDGLDAFLDNKYHEVFPFEVKSYVPTAKRTRRLVLAELFSGSGCMPCISVDLAYDGILRRYKRDEVAVLVFHVHNPRPDPMANAQTTARSAFYGVRGVPAVAFDGDFTNAGVGSPEWSRAKLKYDEFASKIDKQLDSEPMADIKLEVSRRDSEILAKAEVSAIKRPSENLRLHIILAEDSIRYNGENGIWYHPYVVRSMAGEGATGLKLDPSGTGRFSHTFNVARLKEDLRIYLDNFEKDPPKEFEKYGGPQFRKKLYDINDKALTVVAFVQDEKTREVLQAALLKVK